MKRIYMTPDAEPLMLGLCDILTASGEVDPSNPTTPDAPLNVRTL